MLRESVSSNYSSLSVEGRADEWAIPEHVREHVALHVRVSKARQWYETVRQHVWRTLHVRASKYGHVTKYWPSRVFEFVIVALVLVHVLLGATFSELVDSQRAETDDQWFDSVLRLHEIFWWCSAVVFTIEYLARLWSCIEEFESWRVAHTLVERHLAVEVEFAAPGGRSAAGTPRLSAADAARSPRGSQHASAHSSGGAERCLCCGVPSSLQHTVRRLRWALKPLSLFDLVMVATFYVPLLVRWAEPGAGGGDAENGDEREYFETLSWFRVLLLLRLERQLKALKRIMQVVKRSRVELLSSAFFTVVTVLCVAMMAVVALQACSDCATRRQWAHRRDKVSLTPPLHPHARARARRYTAVCFYLFERDSGGGALFISFVCLDSFFVC
jgi:hypothetical protein